MTMIKSLLFGVSLVLICQSIVEGYMYLKPMKEGRGNCIDNSWKAHPIGSTWHDEEKCEMQECLFYEDILYVRGYGCGAIGISPECEIVDGAGPEYPDCCPEAKCPGDENYEYYSY